MQFHQYLRQLKPSLVFQYFLPDTQVRILSEEVYKRIEERHCSAKSVQESIEKFAPEMEQEFLAIYCSGGKLAPQDQLKTALLQTFLVCEGVRGTHTWLFPFEDLRHRVAEYYTACQDIPAPQKNIGLRVSGDCAILGGLAFQGAIQQKKMEHIRSDFENFLYNLPPWEDGQKK
ncbi:hypothetical protein [Chitinivibrio alkaliphilus]|uniref:Uncharacterized protein n=1 Tax=Chitinivibrio alkaliphilus ACht1 TaxID=1313304 RepID=U7DA86_9BACT|nr:hypothetical protein [Chitinivibrio alkaliphilus]ERP39304.1 hypothetical protein CALK_0098 [Chitinivibrio alkaliphilus ACht1]